MPESEHEYEPADKAAAAAARLQQQAAEQALAGASQPGVGRRAGQPAHARAGRAQLVRVGAAVQRRQGRPGQGGEQAPEARSQVRRWGGSLVGRPVRLGARHRQPRCRVARQGVCGPRRDASACRSSAAGRAGRMCACMVNHGG